MMRPSANSMRGTALVAALLTVIGCSGQGASGPAPTSNTTPSTAIEAPVSSATPVPNRASIAPPAPTASPMLPLAGLDGWIAYSIGDSRAAKVRLVRPDGSDNHAIAEDAGPRSNHPEWMPDGRSLLFEQVVGRDDVKSIWRWDMAKAMSTEIVPCADQCVGRQAPAPSADGSRIAYETYDGPIDDVTVATSVAQIPAHCGLQVMTLATRTTKTIETGPCGVVEWRVPRWSPKGDLAYFRTHQSTRGGPVDLTELIVRDMASGKDRAIHDWPAWDEANQLEWSPDGTWIVFSTQGRIDRIHPDGSGDETLVEAGDAALSSNPYHPRFLADGRTLTFDWSIAPRGVITSVRLFAMPAAGGAPTEVLPEGESGTDEHYNWGSLQPTP
jgi:Tol biopolymer transport system component